MVVWGKTKLICRGVLSYMQCSFIYVELIAPHLRDGVDAETTIAVERCDSTVYRRSTSTKNVHGLDEITAAGACLRYFRVKIWSVLMRASLWFNKLTPHSSADVLGPLGRRHVVAPCAGFERAEAAVTVPLALLIYHNY